MEEYEKDSYKFIGIACAVIFVVCFFNYISFDNTKLENVDMEPFSEPIQKNIENGQPFKKKLSDGDLYITPIAEYKIYGRVYDHHRRPSKLYWATVYPYDVSIGFGDFQFKEIYRAIKVRMVATVAYWSYSGENYRKHVSKYFRENSFKHCFTNNHLCPANKNVESGIKKLRKKDIVYIEGYLISFKHVKNDGQIEIGTSSTSRNDTEASYSGDNGSGSCEQIYVKRIVSRHGDYR